MEARHGVYILTNSETPGIVKIGMTVRHVDDRIPELHQTGTIGRFSCAGFIRTDGYPEILERKLHGHFREHRVNNEFFRVAPETVIAQAQQYMCEGDTVVISPKGVAEAKAHEKELEEERLYRKRWLAQDAQREAIRQVRLKRVEEMHYAFDDLCSWEDECPLWREKEYPWHILGRVREWRRSLVNGGIAKARRELGISEAYPARDYERYHDGIKLKEERYGRKRTHGDR